MINRFCERKSTEDNLNKIWEAIGRVKEHNKKLFIVSIDIKKTYDTLVYATLIDKLIKLKADKLIIKYYVTFRLIKIYLINIILMYYNAKSINSLLKLNNDFYKGRE